MPQPPISSVDEHADDPQAAQRGSSQSVANNRRSSVPRLQGQSSCGERRQFSSANPDQPMTNADDAARRPSPERQRRDDVAPNLDSMAANNIEASILLTGAYTAEQAAEHAYNSPEAKHERTLRKLERQRNRLGLSRSCSSSMDPAGDFVAPTSPNASRDRSREQARSKVDQFSALSQNATSGAVISNKSVITIPLSQGINTGLSLSCPTRTGVTTRSGAQRDASNGTTSHNQPKPRLLGDAKTDARQNEKKGPESFHEPDYPDGQSSSG